MIESAASIHWQSLRSQLRPLIAKHLRASDVDDALQDVFLKVQLGLPTIREEDLFGRWLYQVTKHVIVDYQRKAYRETHPGDNLLETNQETTPDTEPNTEQNAEQELSAYVATFVSMLPSPYREALTLTELEGLSQKDAAEMLGISVSGMKSRVQRGRQKLREAFEDCCTIETDARGRVIDYKPRPDGKPPNGCCK